MMYEQLSLGREVLFTHVGSPKQAEDTQVHRSRRKERALGWHCKPATIAGMPQWTRKIVHDWKEQVLCLYSKKRTWKITKPTGWSASSQLLWKLRKNQKNPQTNKQKQQQKTPSIFNLLEVTRNNQPRFVICKSSWQHCLLSVMNCLSVAGAHWQPFMPIAVRFLTLSHSWPNRRHELNGWTQDGLGTD